jgi:hypothetical protein
MAFVFVTQPVLDAAMIRLLHADHPESIMDYTIIVHATSYASTL